MKVEIFLIPFMSPKTETVEYRYRQQFSNGEIMDKGCSSEDDIRKGVLRNYYNATGNFELGFGLNFIRAGVSDEDYLDNYAFGQKSDLNSQVGV